MDMEEAIQALKPHVFTYLATCTPEELRVIDAFLEAVEKAAKRLADTEER